MMRNRSMPAVPPQPTPEVMSIAFDLIFRKGRSPPSCPAPDDNDLLNCIRDKAQNESPAMCRDALIRIQRLSHDVYDVCNAFRESEYGNGDEAMGKALTQLQKKCPGLSQDEYRTAFAVGMMWTAF
jgi:hypothetical protein